MLVVVKDDRVVCGALVTHFQPRFRMVACPDAVSAAATLSDETRAILLDAGMRGRGSVGVCDEIRKWTRRLPVIFLPPFLGSWDPREPGQADESAKGGTGTRDDGARLPAGRSAESIERLVEAVEVALRLQRITAAAKNLLQERRRDRRRIA
jgi:hypothetical protein